MRLDNQYLIEQFHQKIDEDYPDIPFEEMKKIVSGSFLFLKEQMENEELPTIRLKYFGTFAVYNNRAKHILKRTERSFKEGNITKMLYNKRIDMLNKFLDKRDQVSE